MIPTINHHIAHRIITQKYHIMTSVSSSVNHIITILTILKATSSPPSLPPSHQKPLNKNRHTISHSMPQ